ncbi:hypothetical protein [Vulcanisaeta distributa]|uniref:hypothetical protein n=1 Tax=Vulcanisaeta distributa TaxID=164451 RepID=UPI0006D07457|nr:hypothetical protein [Vulcanisaeta distributa]
MLLKIKNDIEIKFRGRYGNDEVNDLLKVINGFVQYIVEVRKYWIENNIGGDEVKKLIEDLRNGRADVAIRRTGKTLTISVYGKYVILEVSRLGGTRVRLILRKIRGITIDVPDIFRKVIGKDEYENFAKILQGLRKGFAETDEGIDGVRPRMGTAQTWQAILWSLLYPGRIRVLINAVDVNVEGVAMVWQLRANNHKSLKNGTYEVLNNKETLMAFMLTAVLGDGYAYITDKPRIKLVIGTTKLRRWESILNRLNYIGFRWSPQPGRDATQITFTAGYAIDLAQAMINIIPPMLRDILDILSIEKWQRIKQVANMEVRFRLGESRVLVGGEPFTVAVSGGSIRLLRKVRDWAGGVYRVLDELRRSYGEEFVSQVRGL